MSLWRIAWRSITQRGVASLLTGLSLALGAALVTAVLLVFGLVDEYFGGGANLGYHFVVGANGGAQQLVLNSVYYLGKPVGNLPYSYYQEFTQGKYSDYVEFALPCCLGDSLEGFKVVGVAPEHFEKLIHGRNSQEYAFAAGENFKADEFFTGVLGWKASRETGLGVGDEFQPTHGVSDDGHKHDPFRVVGVLAPTGTPVDNAVFINIEGFYLLEGHALPPSRADHAAAAAHEDHDHDDSEHAHDAESNDDHAHDDHDHDSEIDQAASAAVAGSESVEHDDHDHAEHESDESHADHDHAAAPAEASAADDHAAHDHDDHGHDDHDHAEHDHGEHDHAHAHEPLPLELREVTAVLVAVADEGDAPGLQSAINKQDAAQAVSPVMLITSMQETFVGPMEKLLLALAALVVVVAGVGVLVSMYTSMNERRREIAVMRALGAGRGAVTTIVLLEAVILSVAGGVAGMFLGHLLVAGLGPWLSSQTGAVVNFLQINPYELVLIPVLIVLAAVVGAAPAATAYRTDVSKVLSS